MPINCWIFFAGGTDFVVSALTTIDFKALGASRDNLLKA
jgi:hypothetical protein